MARGDGALILRLINPRSTLARLTRTDWLIVGTGTIVFVAVAFIRTAENALAVSVAFYVLATVIQTTWNRREDPRLWALIGTVATVQLPVAFLVYIPPRLAKAVCIGPFNSRRPCALAAVQLDRAAVPAYGRPVTTTNESGSQAGCTAHLHRNQSPADLSHVHS